MTGATPLKQPPCTRAGPAMFLSAMLLLAAALFGVAQGKAISATEQMACYIKQSDRSYCFGTRLTFNDEYTEYGDFVDVEVGEHVMCWLESDGTLKCSAILGTTSQSQISSGSALNMAGLKLQTLSMSNSGSWGCGIVSFSSRVEQSRAGQNNAEQGRVEQRVSLLWLSREFLCCFPQLTLTPTRCAGVRGRKRQPWPQPWKCQMLWRNQQGKHHRGDRPSRGRVWGWQRILVAGCCW